MTSEEPEAAGTVVQHDYHLVDPSPWPFVGALGVFVMLAGAVLWMNKDSAEFGILAGLPWFFAIGLGLVIYTLTGWWRDMVQESVLLGAHTPVVTLGLHFGVTLFLVMDVMFFAPWFWAFFRLRLFAPAGGLDGILPLDPWYLPLLNTVVLLTSATTVAWAERAIRKSNNKGAVLALLASVLLGATSIVVQVYDLAHAPFGFGLNGLVLQPFSDPAHVHLAAGQGNLTALYGSAFFMLMGSFVFHALIGAVFLTVCLGRAASGHFTPARHFGFVAASWYWRFVCMLWLILFAGVYLLGGLA